MTVRVVGLTDDPNGAYAYYGGASVLSDNVITAMAGSNDFGNLPVYLSISISTMPVTRLRHPP